MKFSYEARTTDGEIQSGTVEARDREAAIATLRRHNLFVVNLESGSDRPFYDRPITLFQGVKTKDLVLFYRQLATLFGAGVSLVEALEVLRGQVGNEYFDEILFAIESDVRAGSSFSEAMAKHPDVFTPLYINIIKSGEETGRLGDVLQYLADHAEKDNAIRTKIRGAMVYPIVVTAIFLLVGTLMMIFVVPQLTSILIESGQELPFVTKLLIFVSDALRQWGLFILLGLLGLGFLVWRWIHTEGGRQTWDFWKIRIPVFGALMRNIYITRFAENFSTLIKGELPILQAITVTADVIGNTVYHDILMEARDEVRGGESISSVLKRYEEFPPIVAQMIEVGERSAQIGDILDKVADFYRQEVDTTVDSLTQLIEPIMILILGVGVGALVAAILLPIYNLAGGI